MSFGVNGTEGSPVVNPCFVISNWPEEGARMTVDGRELEAEDVKVGHPRTVVDKDLVVWLRMQSEEPVSIVIEAES
jgi:hypothetical protein